MPILMTDIYAGEQGAIDLRNNRMIEEQNKIKLAEQRRTRDEAARARDILTGFANKEQEQVQGFMPTMPPSTAPGDLVPQENQGLIPQAELTGFGGLSTPQQGPTGLQPQDGLTGLGGMQPTGMTPDQAPVERQAPAQGTLMSAYDNSEATYTKALSKVDQVKQISNEMRKAGLHDQADAYEMKTYKLQEAADNAKKAHLDVSEKMLDYIGSQANGYLKAVQDPTANPEAAWQRMLLDLSANGVDIDEEVALHPSERAAYAQQARDAAVSSKDQIALQRELLRETNKNIRAKATNSLRESIQADKTKEQGLNREYKERRLAFAKDKQAYAEKKAQYTVLHDGIKTDLDLSKTQLSEIDKTIDDYNTRKLELDKGNLYYDTQGNAISSSDEEVRAQESKFLNDQISLLSGRKIDLLKSVQDLGTEQEELERTFTGLQKEPGAKPEPKAAASKFVYTSKADATSRKNYEAFMAQSKSIQDPAERSRVQVAAQNRMLENGFITNK